MQVSNECMSELSSSKEDLIYEVHDCVRDTILEFVESLEEWSPSIPEAFRNDEMFVSQSYAVTRTPMENMLNVDLRVHKSVGEVAPGMLTICTSVDEGSVTVEAFYVFPPRNGFTKWGRFESDSGGTRELIESETVRYDDPEKDGYNHSDEEIVEIVGNVIDVMESMMARYGEMDEDEVLKLT
jgi:hypothetical protein